MKYDLDPAAAKQADQLNSRIDEKGKYLGVFTRAEAVTSKKGSKGVDFSFKADSGATADYLTIWTHNAEGKQLMGFNALMAIMTCMSVRTLQSVDVETEKYDNEIGQRAKMVVPLFRELMDKPIGLLIHMEEYEKRNGDTAWKPAITAPFNKDGFTASEILNKSATAATLDKMLDMVRDRPLKASKEAKYGTQAPSGSAGLDEFDDSIPF